MTPKVQITVAGYQCSRCGRQWVPRSQDPPAVCPTCKSPYWDRPRRQPRRPRVPRPPQQGD